MFSVINNSSSTTVWLSRFLVPVCAFIIVLINIKPLLHDHVLTHNMSDTWLTIYSAYLHTTALLNLYSSGVLCVGLAAHLISVYKIGRHR